MNRRRVMQVILHSAGILLVIWVAIEFFTFGGLFFPFRHYRRVEVTSNIGPSPVGWWLIECRAPSETQPRMIKIPKSDGPSIKPGENILLMTADWNIKGPEEQRVTLWRLMKAYRHWIAVAYLLFVAGLLTSRSTRTQPWVAAIML